MVTISRSRVHECGRLLALVLAIGATAATQRLGRINFTIPDGFELQATTTTNLVLRPVNASFDDQGRLFVTDSSGVSDDPKEQAKNPQWRVVRLADADGDGTFDESVVVADKLPMLQGILWHPSGLYIGGTPAIWKLTDFDSEGHATRRKEWWNVGHPSTHCGNEVHGPYAGPDGFIYWTKGAFEPVSWTNSFTGRVHRDRGAHIFRARPDGSAMESLMTGGMDNPVGVAFQPDGEVLFTSTFIDFTQPGFRDGLAHASYGAVFGKVNDNVEDRAVIRTGPDLMHPIAQLGAAAPSGLVRYEGTQFGPSFQDRILVAEFNHRKVSSHALKSSGASFAAESTDLIATDDLDFHPTDVLADADGSVLVVDTGGWYKLCCPSSQLWKPDVLGTIYRLRKTGAPRPADPWGRQLAWPTAPVEELAMRLGDERPAVRAKAAVTLGQRGAGVVPTLADLVARTESMSAALGAVWTLARIDAPAARAELGKLIGHPPPIAGKSMEPGQLESVLVRAALKALARQRDVSFKDFDVSELRLLGLLAGSDAAVRRNAAEVFGQLGTDLAATTLLNSTHETVGRDPVLSAAVLRGLVDSGRAEAVRPGLTQSSGRRGPALVALAEMGQGHLAAASVAPFLVDSERKLRELARWIIQRRPEWGGELAAWFRHEVSAPSVGGELLAVLPIFTASDSGRELLGELLGVASTPVRNAALSAISGAGLKQVPEAWWRGLVKELSVAGISAGDPAVAARTEAAVAAARGLSRSGEFSERLGETLAGVAANPSLSVGSRVDALGLIAPGRSLKPPEWQLLLSSLQPAVAPAIRAQAAEALGRAKLSPVQLQELLPSLPTAGPLEFGRLLNGFDRGGDDALGQALIAALGRAPAARSVAPGQWAAHFAKFSESIQNAGRDWVLQMSPDTRQQGEQLTRLLAELQALPRDVRHGQLVFNSTKAACSACHRIGYQGGNLGPDLTSISQGRSERDLLEAVVYPSASFVRSFEPVLITTKAGEDIAGLIRKETETELVLGTGPGAEQRVAKSDVAERRPGTVSVMPAGLDTQLSRQELADLIAFLKNTKWGAN